jgi:hypothetical protein
MRIHNSLEEEFRNRQEVEYNYLRWSSMVVKREIWAFLFSSNNGRGYESYYYSTVPGKHGS